MTSSIIHIVLSNQQFLAQRQHGCCPPPFLFTEIGCLQLVGHYNPKLKMKLEGCNFDNIDGIQMKFCVVLNNLIKINFQGAFQQWRECKSKCIFAQRNYFEGQQDLYNEYIYIRPVWKISSYTLYHLHKKQLS